MKISDIVKQSQKPSLYEKGTAIMWTDEHISKQLLNVHLNQDTDLASRKDTTINSTLEWILENTPQTRMNILDLGCGPGLYSKRLAEKGHKVTGVDFSISSLEYARKEAENNKLDITYRHQNYLELQDKNKYDLVLLIYTDFGVLLPEEQNRLLDKINKSLKPGGIFIFDVLNDKNIEEKVSPKNWEIANEGFWRDHPYILLSDSFHYPEDAAVLYQHMVIDDFKTDIYRFWTHFYSQEKLDMMLKQYDFQKITFHENVLPKEDLLSGHTTFCIANKI
jgi:SAM-dependent methyltransferase